MLATYLKLGLFGLLRHAPRRLGAKSDTRFHWALRKIRLRSGEGLFEQYLETLGEGSICIDLGANIGTVTQRLLQRAGKVYAVEPEPWAFRQLQQRVGDTDRAILINKAIGARDGRMEMFRDPAFAENPAERSQGTSAYQAEGWTGGAPERFDVEVVDICRFLREIGAPVDLLKMDIEGAEVDVLDRLLSSPERELVRTVFVETHEAQLPELRGRTRALRARVARIDQPKIFLNWQ